MTIKALVAALSLAISDQRAVPDGFLLLFPEGDNIKSHDGRPEGISGWKLNSTNGTALAAKLNKRPIDTVIDYEHQTILKAVNGKPAPASGWIKAGSFEYVKGFGLCSNNYAFTDAAQASISADEYKYKSPVIFYEKDGTVTGFHSLALTNDPALTELDPVALSALLPETEPQHNQKENTMKPELKALLCNILGLSGDVDENAILAALSAATAQVKDKLSIDLTAPEKSLAALASHVVGTLENVTPDPAQFVPIAALTAANDKIAELAANQKDSEADTLIAAALSDGRIVAAQKDWAQAYAKSDIDGFKAYLSNAPKLGDMLSDKQSSRANPDAGGGQAALSADQKTIAEMFGHDEKDLSAAMTQTA